MPLIRRTRAAAVMIALWAVAASLLGVVFALCLWGFSNKPHWHELVYLIKVIPLAFAAVGALAGTAFTLALAFRSRESGLEGLSSRRSLYRWIAIGAFVGFVLHAVRMREAGFPLLSIIWPINALVVYVGVCGALSGIVGSATIAIARRGKTLPSSRDAEPMEARGSNAILPESRP